VARRSYRQPACGLATALDLVGPRWTLLIVRELLVGPLRYTDLLDRLSGIGSNLLATRLHQLEEMGVVQS
jgi:DNA-binding HxlR family transcriptional regulator